MSVAVDYADLVAIALFIYGLHELNSPATARRGNRLAMAGMTIALVGIIIQTGGAGWPSVPPAWPMRRTAVISTGVSGSALCP